MSIDELAAKYANMSDMMDVDEEAEGNVNLLTTAVVITKK